jgi:hypothetical protein
MRKSTPHVGAFPQIKRYSLISVGNEFTLSLWKTIIVVSEYELEINVDFCLLFGIDHISKLQYGKEL